MGILAATPSRATNGLNRESRGSGRCERLSRLEILDRAAAAQVEEIGASAVVSSAAALALRHVGETMFDSNALS